MPKHDHHPFENQIFSHFREQAKSINVAINLLAKQGYTIIDLEGQVITKWNVNDEQRSSIDYKRAPKMQQY
jgi:hypothetical protein